MIVTMACGAMDFGPNTPLIRSLGGSETAALMAAKEIAKRGHTVRLYCNIPPPGAPDHIPAGTLYTDGVTYYPLPLYQEHAQWYRDIAIVVRDPGIAALPVNARKVVLWMHDIATKKGMQRVFDEMAWCIDEVWAVSEWYRRQINEATDYPLDYIVPLRNGIVPVETIKGPRSKTMLLYAARPERGLENLIKEGGIMERLPEYQLKVAMYEHFPDHMKGYYEYIFSRIRQLPNVELIGGKSQTELRQLMSECAAYIYPTQFEETSCIIARECIEQGTPFLTTKEGALPETLGDCGLYFEDWCAQPPEKGSVEWCAKFAEFFRDRMEQHYTLVHEATTRMSQRTDLYWDGVAEMMERHFEPRPVKEFSRAWSLIQDGDVIAAKAYLDAIPHSLHTDRLRDEIVENYPFLLDPHEFGYVSMAGYYSWVYAHKAGGKESELYYKDDFDTPRVQMISQALAELPEGSTVYEYGCGPGHLLATLAKRFPKLNFVGSDIADNAIEVLCEGAAKAGRTNLQACGPEEKFEGFVCDLAIISEVLEHTLKPWEILQKVEAMVRRGGKMITTTPFGPWEQSTIRKSADHWNERAHIWLLDSVALTEMLGRKPNFTCSAITLGHSKDTRPVGTTVCFYEVDHAPIPALDPYEKALKHHSRQTVVACIIAYNNEDTIVKMLNSINHEVQWVNIALGPSTDNTRELVQRWFEKHPWIGYTIFDVPKIEAWKYGFDHARIASTRGMESFDWMLWIDTDEFLTGSFTRFLRHNMLTGYIIPQHHFTVEPRGMPIQIDRPARLLRTGAGYIVQGHIHEHFEMPEGGVGRVYMLPNVDIGHVGYENEAVRKGRFERNFPFLEWDHSTEEGRKRKLHHFLWFRDIVHRMRNFMASGDHPSARKLANEGLEYYNAHAADMASVGFGLQMSAGYISEILHAMGMGVGIKFAVGVEEGGQPITIEGRFKDYEHFESVIRTIMKPSFEARAHKYWG